MKLLVFFVATLLGIGCMMGGNGKKEQPVITGKTDSVKPGNEPLAAADADTISLTAVGDMMLGTNFPNESKLPPADGKELLAPVKNYLSGTDICFGNVEGTFLDRGGIPKGSGANVYCFRQPTHYANYLIENGFNLLSVANNHVADFGEPGMRSTAATLEKLKVAFAGLAENPTTTINIRNLKIGLAAFAPHKGCVNMNDLTNTAAIVRKLKSTCHIVIVSFHGGAEGTGATHVPKRTEIFFGQNRGNVHAFAHAMIDAGADVVIGHGPHVPRGMELYKNKFIAYSLGNFCTYGMFSLHGPSAVAPLLKIRINEKGEFIDGNIVSVKQLGEGGPLPDESQAAFELIGNLSAQDFPGNELAFLPGGKLGRK